MTKQTQISDLAHHRTIIALDIQQSTRRPDPVKAQLRDKAYELFDAAFRSAGILPRHHDKLVDRGDGFLALVHPVQQAPKAKLLERVIPALGRLMSDYNAGLPHASRAWQLRVRVVIHAGEVRYDSHGCFGESLDIAFRLLDDSRVKKALQAASGPLVPVISGDIYSSVVRHSQDPAGQYAYRPLGYVRVAGNRHPGWIGVSGEAVQHQLIDITSYRRPA